VRRSLARRVVAPGRSAPQAPLLGAAFEVLRRLR